MQDLKLKPPDNIHPPQTVVTIQEINQANQRFWSHQRILMNLRTSDKTLLELALADLKSEHDRGVPVRAQKTIEKAFEDVENLRTLLHARFSRKGGQKRKSDVLQDMVDGFVSQNPDISEKDLLSRLKKEIGEGTIESIESEADCLAGDQPLTRYVDENGKEMKASVRGLKDRLSRAKKKYIRANR
jgi:hypothetical protein